MGLIASPRCGIDHIFGRREFRLGGCVETLGRRAIPCALMARSASGHAARSFIATVRSVVLNIVAKFSSIVRPKLRKAVLRCWLMWDFPHQPNGWLRLTDGRELHHGSGTQHLSTESKASAMRCDRHGPIHWREPHTLQVMLTWLPTVRLAATGLRKNLSSMPCLLADVSRRLF
jgi:hypothetical protein